MKRLLVTRPPWLSRLVVLTLIVIAVYATAWAEPLAEERMQPMAARVGDVAAAVRSFAAREPALSAKLSEAELYMAATAHDTRLREPFKEFLVKARPSGVVLVCTVDGKRGLVEDAACTTKVDAPLWREERPCEFCLDLKSVCPGSASAPKTYVSASANKNASLSRTRIPRSAALDLPDDVLVTDYAWIDGINGREPVTRLTSPTSISPLYLWIMLKGNQKALDRLASGKLPLRHVWLRVGPAGIVEAPNTITAGERDLGIVKDDKLVRRLQMEVDREGRFGWRTWSFKRNVYPGLWAVRILYADNTPVRCLENGRVIDDCVVTIEVAPR